MSISQLKGTRAPDGREGIYLRSMHGGVDRSNPIVRLQALKDGQPIEAKMRFDAERLSWEDGEGHSIEAVLTPDQTLRLRGRGLGLRLESVRGTHACLTGAALVALNCFAGLRHYQVEGLAGRMNVEGTWSALHSKQEHVHGLVKVDLLPGDDGAWEAAVDEFWGTWIPRARPDFDAALGEARASFNAFLGATPHVPPAYAGVRGPAAYINWSSVVAPCGLLQRPTMLMSKNWMTDVWSWDHCFNALALAHGMPDLAWDQMLIMADHQDSHGLYPDSLNDVRRHYNFTKPPVHGWAAMEVWRRNPAAATRERLQTMYASLRNWTNWWLERRRFSGQKLPYYMHGNDSGWDNSTLFDDGVPLCAPDLAAFLVLQMDALHAIASHLGMEAEAEHWAREADEMCKALLSELWREGRFIARLALTGAEVRSDSLLFYIPLLLGPRLPQGMRECLVHSLHDFETDCGLASELPRSAKYEADGYWRGPIWGASTHLLVDALQRSGYPDMARRLAIKFCEMCSRSGLPENFDAHSGAPLRDPAYTWTSSCFLLIAETLTDGVNAVVRQAEAAVV